MNLKSCLIQNIKVERVRLVNKRKRISTLPWLFQIPCIGREFPETIAQHQPTRVLGREFPETIAQHQPIRV